MWLLYPLSVFWSFLIPCEFIYSAYVYYIRKDNTRDVPLSD